MSPPCLLLMTALALAGSYQDLRTEAAEANLLVPDGTPYLLGMGGEEACAAHLEDCGATSEPFPEGGLMELGPVDGLLLPPLGRRGPSVLLHRLPLGLSDSVAPALGPPTLDGLGPDMVRVDLGPQLSPPSGSARVTLLVSPGPVSAALVPVELGRTTHRPPLASALAGGAEEPAPQWLSGSPGRSWALWTPVVIRAIRVEAGDLTIEQAAAEPGLSVTFQEIHPEPLSPALLARLVEDCGRAMAAPRRGRRYRGAQRPVELQLILARDSTGRVLDATALDMTWSRSGMDQCLAMAFRRQAPRPALAGEDTTARIKARLPGSLPVTTP